MSTEELSKPMRIVVADDDGFVRSALLDFLSILGHEALPAKNGREAAQILDQHGGAFDLLITDICMPEMDGVDLIRHVRKWDENLPIIAITGYADNTALDHITHLDIPIFTKPLNFAELKQHLPYPISDRPSDHPHSDDSAVAY